MEAGVGIEPTIKELQSSALPLCYPANQGRLYYQKYFKLQGLFSYNKDYLALLLYLSAFMGAAALLTTRFLLARQVQYGD